MCSLFLAKSINNLHFSKTLRISLNSLYLSVMDNPICWNRVTNKEIGCKNEKKILYQNCGITGG